MKLEELEKVLGSHPAIKLWVLPKEVDGELNRDRCFTVRGAACRIQWWYNICYLYVGELQIPFHDAVLQGTWPNGFKVNLQFYYNRAVCAILPLEEYETTTG